MTDFNYSFELHDFKEAITPYGTFDTSPPSKTVSLVNNFESGEHFRTQTTETGALTLDLEDRLLTVLLDESGSMTWNDNKGDRYTYLKRLLNKLDATYPGKINANLIGFGGVLTRTDLFITQANVDFLTLNRNRTINFDAFLQDVYQDSVFDFAGVRVVRRIDRFPLHPADGIVVSEGIFEATKDEELIEGQRYYYGVWVFNKDLHFSQGKFVSAIPQDRILPKGVNFADAEARTLPGVERDGGTQVIYNFPEGSGFIIFDSSGKGRHGIVGSQVIEENFWLGDAASGSHDNEGDLKKPVGVRLDGEFDIIETTADEELAYNGSGQLNAQPITVNLWIFRYSTTKESWLIGTSFKDPTNDIGWAIGLKPNGNIAYQFSDISLGFTIDTGVNVPEKEWTMITIRFGLDTFRVYKNGLLENTLGVDTTVDGSMFDALYIGAKPVDSSAMWFGGDYFGSLNLISVSNADRTDSYISALYTQELKVFNQPINDAAQNPPDNTQREVLISWIIGDNDFDFEGGTVRVLRKYRAKPSHENDGTIVVEQPAAAGEFFFLDAFDFVNNADYYYRIFTFNTLGNPCDRLEARILPVHIPFSVNQPASPPLSTVTGLTATNGNKKVMLEWANPTDERIVGTKIFYGSQGFPVVNIAPQGDLQVTNGVEAFDTQDESFFVHRTKGQDSSGNHVLLKNAEFHYYTVITYDRTGRISASAHIVGIPSALLNVVFPPEEVNDIHITIVNPETLSVMWENPVVRSDELELFFGEAALIFITTKDIFGGTLEDVDNLKLKVCTSIEERKFTAAGIPLGGNSAGDGGEGGLILSCFSACGPKQGADCGGDNCNSAQEDAETILSFATISSGLIKGLLSHTNDKFILARRQKYEMLVQAKYSITEPETGDLLFEFRTNCGKVVFNNPIEMAMLNLLDKKGFQLCGQDRIDNTAQRCVCPEDTQQGCPIDIFNGGFTKATQPYICRVEIQYKGESLPEGAPINIRLFKKGSLSNKSDRTFIREGIYRTSVLVEESLDADGNPAGGLVTKSLVDIEVLHPQLPDSVDIYASLNFGGIFADGIHSIRFVNSLFLQADLNFPFQDGIEVAEQFAVSYQVDPDNPCTTPSLCTLIDPDDPEQPPTFNPEFAIPVPDGTLIKWNLAKLRFGRDRPFYSIEPLAELISGVYSATKDGLARNIFFGPVGSLEAHQELLICKESTKECCVAEEYSIKASVVIGDESSSYTKIHTYTCPGEQEFASPTFLMNAATDDDLVGPFTYATWADGEHLLHFKIAKNPAISSIQGSDCFRKCFEEKIGGPFFPFPLGHIVQIHGPCEILWDVVFAEDEYTATEIPISFESVIEEIADGEEIQFVANIPIRGEETDFFIRCNKFIGDDGGPRPCASAGVIGGGLGGGGEPQDPCQFENICHQVDGCFGKGTTMQNVTILSGESTIIIDNKPVTIRGGGGYQSGMPPILVGFFEPLAVNIIEGRINGSKIQELVVDGVSSITFVTEVKFADEPVPDGTIVELLIEGPNPEIINLQGGANDGIIFTTLVNDPIINPSGAKRSLAYFTIDPINNVQFSATIRVTCRFDKLGTTEREIKRCVTLTNTINVQAPDLPPALVPGGEEPVVEAATSNEAIVYNTVDDVYTTTTAGLIRRMGHFADGVLTGTADFMYVFGGYTGSAENATANITPISEIFNVATATWEFTTDMPTPRAFGMIASKGDAIYTIGGIELDPLTSNHVVSRKIESFDTVTELWNSTLAPMPEDNPVAYGDAQVCGDYIYVTCGITEILSNYLPGDLNLKILRYSINDDEWTIITPSNELLYKRLSPFGFYRRPTNPPSGHVDQYYIYGGSVPKTTTEITIERTVIINERLDDFRSFILTSAYFQNLSISEQEQFISQKEQEIIDSVSVPAFIYLATGFRFTPGEEFNSDDGALMMDISDTVDDDWPVLPKTRDNGAAVYVPQQDVVYFMGGSNQNQSTTLNRNESIDLSDGSYSKNTSFNRGRAHFGAVNFGDDIYLTGGLTSGHKEGFVNISVIQFPEFVEALGTQSCGLLITLTNDSGELIEDDIEVFVRGRLRLEEIDNILSAFIIKRGVDRALGGDGSGTAPGSSDADIIKAQNSIKDPNSDGFQFDAARKITEDVLLFPVLYSRNEFIIKGGVGGTTLLPRSEDPLADFDKLAAFIEQILGDAPGDQEFDGDLEKEELAALGDVLQQVKLPPTILNSGSLRDLYDIETIVTVVDTFYFGETVSDFDFNIQQDIISGIEAGGAGGVVGGGGEGASPPEGGDSGGAGGGETPAPPEIPPVPIICNLNLTHISQPDIPIQEIVPDPPSNNPDPGNPAGSGGFNQSGQCLFCLTVLPLNVQISLQKPTVLTHLFNATDWVPQIKKRLIKSDHTLDDVVKELDIIDHEVPFGSSQLFNAMFESARITTGEKFNDLKKSIYIASDNSQNLSIVTRQSAIDEINSIDGDKKVPAIYTVFSTSFPLSIAALLQRAELGDVEKITKETAGQSTTLIDSSFMDQILNLTIGSATGGLGFGIYTRILDFGTVSAITGITLTFSLPANTDGFLRFRHSTDGFNFGDFSERFQGNQFVNLVDFFARFVEIEVILTTGFSVDITEEYDLVATGTPELTNVEWEISGEREDFIFVNEEDVLTNVQQLAAAFDGDVPENASIQIGVAASVSHNWKDFQTKARPSLEEIGKTFLIDRTDDPFSFVPIEPITSTDGILYNSNYGPWDPDSTVVLFIVLPISEAEAAGVGVGAIGEGGFGEGFGGAGDSGAGAPGGGGIGGLGIGGTNGGSNGSSGGSGGPGGSGGGSGTGGSGQSGGGGGGQGFGGNLGGIIQESDTVDIPVLSGFRLYPREGQIYFDTRQPLSRTFKMAVINSEKMRVGLRLLNRLHTNSVVLSGVGFIYSTNDVKPVELSQVAPKALNPRVIPSQPNTSDTIFAFYDYVDLNGDPESNSIISWFKNGVQLLEIQGKTSFTQENIEDFHKLEPADQLFFSVTPSDGKDLGATVFAPTVTIVAQPPSAGTAKIVPFKDNIINARFDTASTFVVEYNFNSDDIGPGSIEHGTIIKWFVNGNVFKEGIFSEIDPPPTVDPKSFTPDEVGPGGDPLHVIGNEVIVEVTPKTLASTGTTITTQTATVVNTIPVVLSVNLTLTNQLDVVFLINDIDITNGVQTEQSEIRWFVSPNGIDFEVVPAFNNQTVVPASSLQVGQSWKTEITPFDGLDLGPVAQSNTVIITS